MAGGGSATKSSSPTGVRIVVAGDRGTGKSSLIITAAAEFYPTNVPPVLPPTRLPEDMYPDRVPVTVIDTSSSLENRSKLVDELRRADAVVLTYACDQPSTFDRLSTFWLPELRRLEIKVPVIVAGYKLDLRDEQQAVSLEQVMSPIMQQFQEIKTCIECSAYRHIQPLVDENTGGFLKLTRTNEWLLADLGETTAPRNKKMRAKEQHDDSERRTRLNLLQYEAIKRELFLLTVAIGTACSGYCLVTFSIQVFK